MSAWLGVVVVVCVMIAPRVLNGPAGVMWDPFGRRNPHGGVASRWTGPPFIVGATTVGLAIAALRMSAGTEVLANASLGATRVLLAAGSPLVGIPLLISVA